MTGSAKILKDRVIERNMPGGSSIFFYRVYAAEQGIFLAILLPSRVSLSPKMLPKTNLLPGKKIDMKKWP